MSAANRRGMRVPGGRLRGHAARLAAVAALGLALGTLLTPLLAPAAHAVDGPQRPPAVPPVTSPLTPGAGTTAFAPARTFAEATPGAPPVRISAIAPQITRPGSTLSVTAVVQNTTDEAMKDVRVVLGVHRFRLQSLDDVVAWSDLPVDGVLGSPVRTVELDEALPSGSSTTVTLTVDAAELQLLELPDTWGPRGLSVSFIAAGTLVDVERSFVLWQSTDEVPQLRLSVLAPLVGVPSDEGATATLAQARAVRANPSTTPSPSASASPAQGDQTPAGAGADAGAESADARSGTPPGPETPTSALDALLTPEGRLGRVVVATAAFPAVSWAIDPAVVDAAAASGSDAGAAWVERVRGAVLGRDLFALGWQDPDPSALTGDGTELQVRASELSGRLGPELLGTTPRTDLAWPVPGTLSSEVATGLVEAGSTIVVAGPDDLAPSRPGTSTPGTRVELSTPAGSLTALVPDAAITSQLVDPRGRTHATQAQWLLALTAVVAHEDLTTSRHVLAALPRDWAPDTQATASQLRALSIAPWIALTPVSTVLGAGDAPDVERLALPLLVRDGAALDGDRVEELLDIKERIELFAPVVTGADSLLDRSVRAVLAPTSIAWRADTEGRAALVETVSALAELRTGGLSVIPGSDINLVSSTGAVPVTVRNELDEEATVDVELRPDSAKLVAAGAVRVVVPARSEQSVWVPVESVANGVVHVEVHLLSPDGKPVARSIGVDITVSAEWENVATAVVAAGLALLLTLGIVRTVRRGRTTTRATAAEAAAAIAEDEGELPPTDTEGAIDLVDVAVLNQPDDDEPDTQPVPDAPDEPDGPEGPDGPGEPDEPGGPDGPAGRVGPMPEPAPGPER